MRINRIRLEFKGYAKTRSTLQAPVLIESDWNLKLFLADRNFHQRPSINRIRLEFKDKGPKIHRRSSSVLIESDWNLKQEAQRTQPHR